MGIFDFLKSKGDDKSSTQKVTDNNQKTVGTVFTAFTLKHEQEIKELDGMVGIEAIDVLRSIINSNFAQDKIQNGLQHRNFHIRKLTEQFLEDLRS